MIRLGKLRSRRFLLIAGALVAGIAAGTFLFSSVFQGEAEREDFQHNSDFFKRGRPDFAICVSDYTADPASKSDLVSRVEGATDENKDTLWKDTFLEAEPVKVESPCPAGPTIDENTTDVSQYITGIRIVEEPGPYVLYVHVVDASLLATLDRLNLEHVVPQEYIDPSPNQPAGYEQVATAIYLSRAEFETPEFLARQVAEALGCTESCSAPAPE